MSHESFAASGRWQWDTSRHQYYYFNHEDQSFVYQSGLKIPATQPTSSTAASYTQQTGYSHSNTTTEQVQPLSPYYVPTTKNQDEEHENLKESFERLKIEDKRLYSEFESRDVKRREFYKPGRVFQIIDYMFQDKDSNSESDSKPGLSRGHVEEQRLAVRKWVVLRPPKRDLVICLPIVAHRSLQKNHVAVYTTEMKPDQKSGSDKLAPRPISITLKRLTDKLKPTAQINFGAITTLPTSLRVRHFGIIAEKDVKNLEAYSYKVMMLRDDEDQDEDEDEDEEEEEEEEEDVREKRLAGDEEEDDDNDYSINRPLDPGRAKDGNYPYIGDLPGGWPGGASKPPMGRARSKYRARRRFSKSRYDSSFVDKDEEEEDDDDDDDDETDVRRYRRKRAMAAHKSLEYELSDSD